VYVDFSDLDLFAITGPNGAGKSSLVEAIVFALYGKGLRLQKEGEVRQLISQGAHQLRVVLEFESGGSRYRIIRETGRRAIVQLEQLTPSRSWQSLADRVKEANTFIQKAVGLDYDAFVRSVVLPQGRFQELLVGDPDKRNRLLSELLRLDIYQDIMHRANERYKRRAQEVQELDRRIRYELADATPQRKRELERECLALLQRRAYLENQEAQLDRAQRLSAQLRDLTDKAHNAQSSLQRVGQEYEQCQARREILEREQRDLAQRLEQLKECQSAISVDYERYRLLVQVQPLCQHLLEAQRKLQALERELHELKPEVAFKQAQVAEKHESVNRAQAFLAQCDANLKAVKQVLDETKDKANRLLPLLERLRRLEEDIRHASRQLLEQEEAFRKARAEEARLKDAHARAVERLDAAQRTWEKAQKLHAALVLRHSLREGQPCPVCGQHVHILPPHEEAPDLDAARQALEQAQAEERRLGQSLQEAAGRVSAGQGALEAAQASHQRLKQEYEGLRHRIASEASLHLPVSQIETALDEERRQAQSSYEEAHREWEKAQKQLEAEQRALWDYEKDLARLDEKLQLKHRQRQEAEEKLQGIQRQLEGLLTKSWPLAEARRQLEEEAVHGTFWQILHDRVKEQLEDIDARLQQLTELGKEQEELRQALEDVRIQLAQNSSRLEELMRSKLALEEELQRLTGERDGLLEELMRISRENQWASVLNALGKDQDPSLLLQTLAQEIRYEREAVDKRIGAIEEQLKRLDKDIAVREDLERKQTQYEKEAGIARRLGSLLQSDRFQKFLRDNALTILAEDASRHLYHLTGGRYTLTVRERGFYVLDHWEGAERPAHSLSGAETFLASLALALALAERIPHLAYGERRPLDSLFIDEGFGTLDEHNLDVVASALEALSSGGRMVGVITHLAALADRLPARLRVQNSGRGSTVIKEW